MKRTADQAFGAAAQPFMPADPKAYFQQYMKSMQQGGTSVGGTSVAGGEKSELVAKLEEASAHKAVELLRGKVETINPVAAVAGLNTLATKSSVKLREELMKLATVKNLVNRIKKMLMDPSNILYKQSLETITRACLGVGKMLGEVQDKTVFDVAIKNTAPIALKLWKSDELANMLWAMAKAEVITKVSNVAFVNKVVKELIDYSRVKEFSVQSLVDLCWAISKSRYFEHNFKADVKDQSPTVRQGHDDEELFEAIAKRVIKEKEDFTAQQSAELACHYARIGIGHKELFEALAKRIMAKQKDVSDERMAQTITAYRKFMFPLKDEAQGFRTMAVVAKGDFVRPSDKPKKKKQEFDKPVALHSTR